jgi:hypothetical protein
MATPLEDDEQKLLVEWLEKTRKDIKFSALPLSTFTKSWSVKNRNKALGVRAGVPDMMLIIKKQLIFIEMKRKKVGVVRPNQQEWIDALNACGVKTFVCYGFDEAQKVIESI